MSNSIQIEGAKVHNLKNLDLNIPRDELVVITGLSGSGKSSLAFDTIYAEGQRRYMETFSAYIRQFVGNFERPEVDKIEGLSPVIAIEQKTTTKNPRSTVGTITDIYDFIRLLYARIGIAYSYKSNKKMISNSDDKIIKLICKDYLKQRIIILSPIIRSRKGHYRELFENFTKQGFSKVIVDGEVLDIKQGMKLDRYKVHDISLVIDNLLVGDDFESKKDLTESIKIAMKYGNDTIFILDSESGSPRYFSRNLMCPDTGISYPKPEPNTFSFNSPKGMCQSCLGLGVEYELNMNKLIPDDSVSINSGGISPIGERDKSWIFRQIELISKYVVENNISRPDDFVIKSSGKNSSLKLFIIQSVDRKLSLVDIADSKSMDMMDFIKEMESIVYSGTKLDLNYCLEEYLDEDQQQEMYDYFIESESDSIELALEEFDGEFDEFELRLYRIKFLSELGN